jgi:hypothetical protein
MKVVDCTPEGRTLQDPAGEELMIVALNNSQTNWKALRKVYGTV